jgi:hypothetical protein
LATVSVTANMKRSSTSILRVKVRPWPLVVRRVSGWPGARVEPSTICQTVSALGRPVRLAPVQPNSAKKA